MSARLPKPSASSRFHGVRFFKDSLSLCEIVAKFVGEGFLSGQPALIVATPDHFRTLLLCLRDRGFDVDRLQRAGDLLASDAAATLERVLVGGAPDAERFRQTLVPLLTQASTRRAGATVRVYGEMVDVLWQSGNTAAAVRLETMWNDLAHHEDFALLCGYSMGNFYKDVDIARICGRHTHVLTEDPPQPLPMMH